MKEQEPDCARTLALWKPGVPIKGLKCKYSWTGKMPCTGRLICQMCGKEKVSKLGDEVEIPDELV